MIIKNVKKIKNKKEYLVNIDNNIYKFNEDTILEYHLFSGKEINDEILDMAISLNSINEYYNMALKYACKYVKSSYEIRIYLTDKGLDLENAKLIVEKLKINKIINDDTIIDSIIYSYIKSYNGKLMIEEKLKSKGFDFNLIYQKLDNIDYDLYIEYLNKLYDKIKTKYDKEKNDYIRINKIKKYLYSRGYSMDDISNLDIK